MEFSKTGKGVQCLIIENNVFHLNKKRNDIAYWVCKFKNAQKCRASVRTVGNYLPQVFTKGEHTCSQSRIETKIHIFKRNMKDRIRNESKSPRVIYKEEAFKFFIQNDPESVDKLPTYRQIASSLYLVKNSRLRDRPKIIEDSSIPSDWPYIKDLGTESGTMIANSIVNNNNGPENVMASCSETKASLHQTKEKENGDLSPPEYSDTANADRLPAEPPNGVFEPANHQTEPELSVKSQDIHVSSEDEDDKLIINEGCGGEKKEVNHVKVEETKREDVPEEPTKFEVETESEVKPSKSPPLKRSVEDSNSNENGSKKPKIIDEGVSISVQNESSIKTNNSTIIQLDESLESLKKDLFALELLLVQKEEEWNSLLRLTKKKEELYLRLSRKRQVIKMSGNERAIDLDEEHSEVADDESVMLLPQGVYSSIGTTHFPLAMMKQVLGDSYVPSNPQVVPSTRFLLKDSQSSNSSSSLQSNISVIDIHTSNARTSGVLDAPHERPQITISPETQLKLSKQLNSMNAMKPILPKPMQGGVMGAPPVTNTSLSGPHPQKFNPTGYGPQGPTVSIDHLIAAHRKDNPHVVTAIRGAKRGAWRHRFEGDRRVASPRDSDRPSSVSSSMNEMEGIPRSSVMGNQKSPLPSSASANHILPMNDPSVSYKDVLLQFAQLTQNEKQPGSPQISIIPVNSSDPKPRKCEPIPDSTSITRELTGSSQVLSQPNLENSSALAKLLMESGGGNHGNIGKNPAMNLSYDNSNPHSLTLSALLSGGSTTNTTKDRGSSPAAANVSSHSQMLQMDSRVPKKVAAPEEEPPNPKCQGCHRSRAQFVCAGCGNQWYCSRHCQVTAWEKHSEHCNN